VLIRQPPIFLMTIEAQASFITEVHQACRRAKESRERGDLIRAGALFDDSRFKRLDPAIRDDLREAYRNAFAASGAGAP
jgi:hypothetical protein